MSHHRLSRIAPLVLAAASLSACGSSADTASAAAPAAAAAAPTPAAPANPTTITLGGTVQLRVPAMPAYALTVPTPGEYQIDAIGTPLDAQLAVYDSSNWVVASDGDSGNQTDARVVTFLAPGTYEVRAYEYQHRAMTGTIAVTQPPPITPAATIAPGAPPISIASPAGDYERASMAEVTLTVAAPGSYRIRSAAVDPNACHSQIQLIANNAVLATDASSGPDSTALITRDLTPGTYAIRVRDWSSRACTQTLEVTGG